MIVLGGIDVTEYVAYQGISEGVNVPQNVYINRTNAGYNNYTLQLKAIPETITGRLVGLSYSDYFRAGINGETFNAYVTNLATDIAWTDGVTSLYNITLTISTNSITTGGD